MHVVNALDEAKYFPPPQCHLESVLAIKGFHWLEEHFQFKMASDFTATPAHLSEFLGIPSVSLFSRDSSKYKCIKNRACLHLEDKQSSRWPEPAQMFWEQHHQTAVSMQNTPWNLNMRYFMVGKQL